MAGFGRTLAVAALLLTSQVAVAAAPATRFLQTPLLLAQIAVPAATLAHTETAVTPAPGQIVEQVRLLRSEDQLVTVDLWSDPLRLGAMGGLAAAMSWLIDSQSRLRLVAAGQHGVPTLVLEQPRSPQSHGRVIALLGSGGVLARITCENSADPGAMVAFEQVLAGFAGPAPAKDRP